MPVPDDRDGRDARHLSQRRWLLTPAIGVMRLLRELCG